MSAAKIIICIAIISVVGGCASYRVEYHKRPAYYKNSMAGPMEDNVTLADGTVLIFTSRSMSDDDNDQDSDLMGDGPRERMQIREESDDGTIVLRAFLPEHVLAKPAFVRQRVWIGRVPVQTPTESTAQIVEGGQHLSLTDHSTS